jgi:hypothetical protein
MKLTVCTAELAAKNHGNRKAQTTLTTLTTFCAPKALPK